MDTYQQTAVENGRNAMTLDDAVTLAELTDNESLSNKELIAVQNALQLYASKTNQVLHITDGGAMYITDDHDLRRASIAKREGMNSRDIYWLELGYAMNDPKTQNKMFDAVYQTK